MFGFLYLLMIIGRVIGFVVLGLVWIIPKMVMFVFYTIQACILIPFRIVRLIVRRCKHERS